MTTECVNGNIRPLKMAAWVLLGLLTVALLASSCLMWYAEYFYPLPETGIVPTEQLPVLEKRLTLDGAQDTMEAILLLVGQLGYPLLLIVSLVKRWTLPAKQKWLYAAITAGAFAAVSAPFAVAAPVFAPVNYFFTPAYLVVVLVLCLTVESGILALRNKKAKK